MGLLVLLCLRPLSYGLVEFVSSTLSWKLVLLDPSLTLSCLVRLINDFSNVFFIGSFFLVLIFGLIWIILGLESGGLDVEDGVADLGFSKWLQNIKGNKLGFVSTT